MDDGAKVLVKRLVVEPKTGEENEIRTTLFDKSPFDSWTVDAVFDALTQTSNLQDVWAMSVPPYYFFRTLGGMNPFNGKRLAGNWKCDPQSRDGSTSCKFLPEFCSAFARMFVFDLFAGGAKLLSLWFHVGFAATAVLVCAVGAITRSASWSCVARFS